MLGFLSSIWIERFRQRNTLTVRILEQYFKIREDICDEISELTNLQIGALLDDEFLDNKRGKLSRYYYKYYDFLPKDVLQALNCLHACLSDERNRIFVCRENTLYPIRDTEIEDFIEQISLVRNFKYYALVPLNSSDSNTRKSASINYQARYVLRIVNANFTLSSLMNWIKKLPK